MLATPKRDYLVQSNVGSVGTLTPGTSITTGAAAGTKGTAVQLIASTNFDAYWVRVVATGLGASAVASEACLDILIGAATESILIPDLLAGMSSTPGKFWDFPLYVPAGSRLAAQAASTRTSFAFNVEIYLLGGGLPLTPYGTKVTTYGATAPNGVAITPGFSAAEGAWTQIVASTSEDHIAVVPSMQIASGNISAANWSLDVGVGAATEEEIGGPYLWDTTSTELMYGPHVTPPVFKRVPASSRLSVRVSKSAASAGGNPECALHCVS